MSMKPKQILAIVLIVFVVGSLAYMIGKESRTNPVTEDFPDNTAPPSQQAAKENNLQDAEQDTQLIVYYFHGDVRCSTCHKLETYAKETLETYFADELAAKEVIWKAVNIDEAQNKHFVQDYELYAKTVVLSMVAKGQELRWENLDRIWQEISDKQGYLEYVRNSIVKFLEDSES